jgi:predicted nucleic acid-binding protein
VILYLGTSSLVKLYAEEPHSDTVREWVREAEIVATCRVAYTEIISTLDARFKKNDLSEGDYERLIKGFSKDWIHYAIIDFDDIEAALLAKKYGLRRFDGMHLSAAKLIKKERRDTSIRFSSLDERLCSAAVSEGLKVLRFN